MSPRRLTPSQLAYLARKRKITANRRHLWKHNRPYMERIRQKATAKATERRDDIKTFLLIEVRSWPAAMTPTQLDDMLLTLPYTRKNRKRRMRRDSLIRRLRLLGLLAYDARDNTWSNLCHLSREETSLNDCDRDAG